MGITIKIKDVDRTEYIDARSLNIVDNLGQGNEASFLFICNDVALAPIAGESVLIEEGATKLFSGRVLTREEDFLPPNLLKYQIGCVDHTRDLNKKLVTESYLNQKGGDIIKDIMTKYTTGFTVVNVADGPEIVSIAFDYTQVSEAIITIAEICGYQWFVDYDRDIHFFFKTAYPASFQLDDDQEYYKDLNIGADVSQLRNRIYVRSSKLANIITQDDEDSIAARIAIEGGDGIFEHGITDNNIDTEEWAIDVAKADLLQNANPVIQGTFLTNQSDVRSGQIITLNSTKRNINQDFLIQRVELIRVDVHFVGYPEVPYKPADTATIGYKPAAEAEVPYKPVAGEYIYYIYQVTIATKLKGLEDLLLGLLYHSNLSLKRDAEAPAVPSGLTLSTGMGLATQATLAWLKAEWNANDEADFNYYELKMKKSTDSDFTVVSTRNITFIWYSLEPGVTFDVYIRAIDYSGNVSGWSSIESKTTATDSDTPVQLAAPTITALLAGIKIAWNAGTEDNISHYKIERQESEDAEEWSEWATITNVDTTMWLDLLLTYTKFYRYRVSSVTQTGNSGNPSDPSNYVKPNQAGTGDIIALAITADLLAANSVYTNALQAGAITAGKIASDAIETTKIKAGAVTADKIDVTSLAAIKAILGTVHAGLIYGTRLRVGGGTDEDIYFEDSGIRLYDAGDDNMRLSRVGSPDLSIVLGTIQNKIESYLAHLIISTASHSWYFHTTGEIQYPLLTSAPVGAKGRFAYNTIDDRPTFHNVGAWRHWTGVASW